MKSIFNIEYIDLIFLFVFLNKLVEKTDNFLIADNPIVFQPKSFQQLICHQITTSMIHINYFYTPFNIIFILYNILWLYIFLEYYAYCQNKLWM